MAFIALLQIELHFPEGSDLKGKRKELQSVKAALQRRFGASVAETDHHDLWQRSSLAAALVAREQRGVAEGADAVERWLLGRFPDGAAVRRTIVSADELRGE
ncbi:MAG: DUF503 domain-containing protein [Thermoleophilaceae bacterium]